LDCSRRVRHPPPLAAGHGSAGASLGLLAAGAPPAALRRRSRIGGSESWTARGGCATRCPSPLITDRRERVLDCSRRVRHPLPLAADHGSAGASLGLLAAGAPPAALRRRSRIGGSEPWTTRGECATRRPSPPVTDRRERVLDCSRRMRHPLPLAAGHGSAGASFGLLAADAPPAALRRRSRIGGSESWIARGECATRRPSLPITDRRERVLDCSRRVRHPPPLAADHGSAGASFGLLAAGAPPAALRRRSRIGGSASWIARGGCATRRL
jgi:hypothetical protein